ncbi:hypothetical protein BASA50_007850 [Batrachochytrium salamandrivorans]|uniref:Complex III subunit 7 n=1 Tax=Batrachochytrium salamandrivorans TaxID=1357716 RepID=A0ABQ8F5V1_9FUNG|nr:hypothetical protein BASA62_007063 [Batrachochytrium salamandrivorans]KAH6576576.1 hypothetical protein BASA60_004451 [Batrachochytrium salamandrivorans]KAH6584139.1 hypothetical protein BASA61_007660 [Batrachochytrium salamandrivorans]KAH6592799.1 hypothetical protein BASA50_007850 [Batrachochytrium salamandrivorans]KAH9246354.1 hypothetical protein BASA81_016091 [Batrachochytrium salamandrivorans]
MKVLESLRTLRNSPVFAKLGEWHSNNMGYRQMGLRYDDLIPDDGHLVKEALRRLPASEMQERNFRFKRALTLSLIKTEAPNEEWTTTSQDIPYLRPLIDLVEAEVATKENFDNLTSIPPALLKRNRSS